MRVGHVLSFQGKLWVVRSMDAEQLRTAILEDGAGQRVEVPHDLDADLSACQVMSHPPTEWPYVLIRDNPRGRNIRGLTWLPAGRNSSPTSLTRLADWYPSDPARAGGPVFLRPSLGVKSAELLLVEWALGAHTRVVIPVSFGTTAQKVARQVARKAAPPTTFDRLLDDRFEDE